MSCHAFFKLVLLVREYSVAERKTWTQSEFTEQEPGEM